jgi:hypothetical protein
MKHAIFLLASLAFASATTTTTTTTDEHSLRGGGGLASRRSLEDVPLVVGPGPGLGPGESNCYLHPDGDGTVECTIRSQFSAYDPIYSKNPTTSLGCVTDPEKGYQYCANIGLNLQADPNGILPPPPGIMGSAASGGGGGGGGGGSVPSTGGVWTGSGSITGSCPRSQPTPGSHCSGWIPEGASESSCLFGAVQCNCAGQGGDANTIGWSCRDLSAGGSGNVITTPITVTPGVSFPITVPAPAPVPVPVPVPVIPEPVVVGNIDAEIVSFRHNILLIILYGMVENIMFAFMALVVIVIVTTTTAAYLTLYIFSLFSLSMFFFLPLYI